MGPSRLVNHEVTTALLAASALPGRFGPTMGAAEVGDAGGPSS